MECVKEKFLESRVWCRMVPESEGDGASSCKIKGWGRYIAPGSCSSCLSCCWVSDFAAPGKIQPLLKFGTGLMKFWNFTYWIIFVKIVSIKRRIKRVFVGYTLFSYSWSGDMWPYSSPMGLRGKADRFIWLTVRFLCRVHKERKEEI